MSTNPTDSVDADQRDGEQSADRRRSRTSAQPTIASWRPPAWNCAGRCCSRRAAPPMCWSRWRRFSRARTSAMPTTLGIPNEDAQSFVFDATTLFERDKFSGYDRIEGGTRANIGLRYTGTFDNGWTANGAGRPVLPTGRREFVRLARPGQCRRFFRPGDRHLRLCRPVRLRLAERPVRPRSARGSTSRRFEVRRSEVKAGYSTDALSLSAQIRLHPGAAALRLPERPQGADARRLDAVQRKLARLRLRHLRFRERADGQGRVRLRL